MAQRTISVRSTTRNQMIDITDEVDRFVRDVGIQQGVLHLFVPHTTAAVTINENADPDVKTDMLHGLSTMVPNLRAFRHAEGNSDAHIKSSLVGVDQTVLIQDGRLVLGTWQGIYFCEFDGPRTRRLVMQITSVAE